MATTIPENRATFTLWELAEASGGELTRAPDASAPIVGVVTDSRRVVPANAFLAIRGDAFDGHDFLPQAIRAGATAVVIERGRSAPAGDVAVIEVSDGVLAFGRIARAHLRRSRRRVGGARMAALTGSAGKTTTKELTRAILSAVAPCHATSGNLNNRIGAPAVALGLERQRYAVFELGMSVPGEIAALAAVIEPDVAALLNVGVAHAQSFHGSRAAIAHEKGAIFEGLRPTGTAVVNADDAAARAQLVRTEAASVLFGVSRDAQVQLVSRDTVGASASRVTVDRQGELLEISLPLVGAAAALDLVAAIAIADATVGSPIPRRLVADAMRAWEPPPGRSLIRHLEGGVLVVDDSYNANPASMRAALATLSEIRAATRGRAVAVMGEMRELGDLSANEHDELGREVKRHGVDLLIGCGGAADLILKRAAMEGVAVRHAASAEEAGALIALEARRGDVILFKGSRGAAVERALSALVARYPIVRSDSGSDG